MENINPKIEEMKKQNFSLKLTPKGEQFLKQVNEKFEDNPGYGYFDLSPDEQLIADIGMYEDNVYTEEGKIYTNLEEFALDIATEEYSDSKEGVKEVIKKINKAINEGWVLV